MADFKDFAIIALGAWLLLGKLKEDVGDYVSPGAEGIAAAKEAVTGVQVAVETMTERGTGALKGEDPSLLFTPWLIRELLDRLKGTFTGVQSDPSLEVSELLGGNGDVVAPPATAEQMRAAVASRVGGEFTVVSGAITGGGGGTGAGGGGAPESTLTTVTERGVTLPSAKGWTPRWSNPPA